MDNIEQNIKNNQEYSDKELVLFRNIIEGYMETSTEVILRDKDALLKKLDGVYEMRAKKEEQIREAEERNASDDELLVLQLELKQKILVVEDLEMNLDVMNVVLDRRASQ